MAIGSQEPSLLCHPLAFKAEGSWLLFGAPVRNAHCSFTLVWMFTQKSKMAEAQDNPAAGIQGLPGGTIEGQGWGSGGRVGREPKGSQRAGGDGPGLDHETCTCLDCPLYCPD